MDFIHLISKAIHISSGALVLLLGLIQMILPKKGIVHRRVGKAYFYLMVVIFFTALPPAVYAGNWFLACVSLFSLYLVWTGRRYAFNRTLSAVSIKDKLITLFGFAAAFGMYLVAILFFMKKESGMAFVPIVFGTLVLLGSIQDMMYFFFNKPEARFGKMHWYFFHLTRMIGSYIAAVTAFIVNVQPLGSHWFHWIWPTILGSIVIAGFTRFYMKKFQLGKFKKIAS